MNAVGLLFIFSIVGAIGFTALLVVGVILLRQEQAARRAKPEAPPGGAAETKSQENKLLEAGRSLFKARSKDADPLGAHEVLRVLRDRLSGRLIVEIAGRRYTQVGDIQDPNIQRGFLTTLQDLGGFATNVSAPAIAPVPQAPLPNIPVAPHAESPRAQDSASAPATPPQPAADTAPRLEPSAPPKSRTWRAFRDRSRNGASSEKPWRRATSSRASRSSRGPWRCQGWMAPSRTPRVGSGTTFAGSTSQRRPRPWQAAHAP